MIKGCLANKNYWIRLFALRIAPPSNSPIDSHLENATIAYVNALEVDKALIRKYNQPGPRYTSYPPANQFKELDDYSPILSAGDANTSPASIYIHLPFCETLCWFCGCHTITTGNRDLADTYLEHLKLEIELSAAASAKREAVQLHFGGGTPNFLRSDQIDRLAETLDAHFNFTSDAEKSVELDPRRLNPDQVDSFARIGLSRASFGIQDSNPEVQKLIHRVQPQSMNVEAMKLLREKGFTSVNLDLIYGLPGQTLKSFDQTLDDALSLQPDRFSIFNYAHVPWMRPAQKLLERAGLPDAEEKLELFTLCIQRLTATGYIYVGMDHFARPEDELVKAQNEKTLQRNFQGYSTHAGTDIRAYGISSISSNRVGYIQNLKDLQCYQASIERSERPIAKGYMLTEDDRIRGRVISRIMCDLSVDFNSFSKEWNIDFQEYFERSLKGLDTFIKDDLVRPTSSGFDVTEKGRLFIRNIAMCFDAGLADSNQTLRYSNTV